MRDINAGVRDVREKKEGVVSGEVETRWRSEAKESASTKGKENSGGIHKEVKE